MTAPVPVPPPSEEPGDALVVSPELTIPRASLTTSGSNFEILVGFEVTPQMAAFNRDGKRFRVNAGTALDSA